jgi:nucleoside-diphosphate-sugar epimerase
MILVSGATGMFGGRIARGLVGAMPTVTDTVEELTGRKPMTVDQWLARNLAAFR